MKLEMIKCKLVNTSIGIGLKLKYPNSYKKVDRHYSNLVYLVATKSDLMYRVTLISRLVENPI